MLPTFSGVKRRESDMFVNEVEIRVIVVGDLKLLKSEKDCCHTIFKAPPKREAEGLYTLCIETR
jgi:hypothetical protein